jgi:uncharacterized protein YjbI with pentapeptide repeats
VVLATLPEHDLEPESAYKAMAVFDLELTSRVAESVEFRQCRFKRASLAGSHLQRVRFADCLVEASDWSNLRGDGGTFDRVKVTDVRMTGLSWADGLLRDAAFSQCKLDLTNWRFATFDVAGFTDCNLAGADFTSADLRGASFTRCDLSGAQFSNATMEGTRFRGCELAGIGGMTSWAGAIVHEEDLLALSYTLAAAMGIVVHRDER